VANPPQKPGDPKKAAVAAMKHRQTLASANQAISRSRRLIDGTRERFHSVSKDKLRDLSEVLAKARTENDRAEREVERAKKNLESAQELRKEAAAARRLRRKARRTRPAE
jgi:ABC-type transporter Mla subunit MlaD